MKNLIHHFPTCYAYSVKMHNSMVSHVERLYSASNLLFGCKESVVLNVLSQAWRGSNDICVIQSVLYEVCRLNNLITKLEVTRNSNLHQKSANCGCYFWPLLEAIRSSIVLMATGST